jgi:hypothetical protein
MSLGPSTLGTGAGRLHSPADFHAVKEPPGTVNGPQRLSEALEDIRISCLDLELHSNSLVLHPVSRSLCQVNTLSDLKATDSTGNARAALVLMSFSHDFRSFV